MSRGRGGADVILKSSAAVAAGVYGMGWGLVDAADPPLEFDGSKFLLKAAEPNRRRPGSREALHDSNSVRCGAGNCGLAGTKQ